MAVGASSGPRRILRAATLLSPTSVSARTNSVMVTSAPSSRHKRRNGRLLTSSMGASTARGEANSEARGPANDDIGASMPYGGAIVAAMSMRVVLVTGGTSGIGLACARLLAADGAAVAL